MIQLPDRGDIFFHNPKAAGSSVYTWVRDHMPGRRVFIEPKHMIPSMAKEKGITWDWSFCIIRNPWDRWVSWWYYWNVKLQRSDYTFEEYTKRYYNGDFEGLTGGQYSHLNVQNEMAKHANQILRYENLTEDFKIIQQRYDIHAPLGHHNSSDARMHYREYYVNSELIDIIAKAFKQDIEEFGYQYEF